MTTISISPHLNINPDAFRDQILSVIAARNSLTITMVDKANLDLVVEMMDEILEKVIIVEGNRK